MRKFFILLTILSFGAVSCINTVEIQVDEMEPLPVINAHLRTDQTEHIIYLTTSQLNRVDPFDNAHVSVSVNGGAQIQAEEIIQEEYYESSMYRFEASFKAGDRVTIHVSRPPYEAKASVVFPEAVDPFDVEWSSHTIDLSYGTEESYRFDIRFSDIKGDDSFYRLDLDVDTEVTSYDGNDPVTKHFVQTDRSIFDASSDPVINEGRSGDSGILSAVMPENRFCVFTDNLFKDSSCGVRVWIPAEVFKQAAYEVTSSKWTLNPVVLVKVFTLDLSYYRYLKALDNFEAFGYEMGLLVEPTTLPSNVSGGLGFVSAETCTVVPVQMPAVSTAPQYN